MSSEFWYGVLVSAALFAMGAAASVFAPDIRSYFTVWRRTRRLRGTELRLQKLQRDMTAIEELARSPGAVNAFFWAGLFSLFEFSLMLSVFVVAARTVDSSLLRIIGAGVFTVGGVAALTLVRILGRRARLSRPERERERLMQEIQQAQAQLAAERT